MSFNPSSPEPIQPLSLGNVVSAGLRLYRSHLKSYLQLSYLAYAWVLIPVYGWAKCAAILASISRLAFGELVEQPESIQNARRIVNSRMWQFLIMGLLMLLINLGLIIAVIIPFVIVAIIGAYTTGATTSNNSNPVFILLIGLLVLIFISLLFVILLWIQARFLIVELPLAIEDEVNGSSTIGRSWNLTKGSTWRIMGIIFVAYLITIPIQLPFSLLSQLIRLAIISLTQQENSSYTLILSLLNLIVVLTSVAIVVPFWQSIKAVIYYDLRSRREGFGLKLRDREV